MKKILVSDLENSIHSNGLEAGCDEAGRGCLAGPVFAAAVVFPPDYRNKDLNDSKKLSESKRYRLRDVIMEEATAFSVSSCSAEEIDIHNILNASILAMHRGLNALIIQPDFIAVDGNRFKPYQNIPYQTVVKGDAKYLHIAAASILAKTYRDDYMKAIALEFPEYQWHINKGYPTKHHRDCVIKLGLTPHHRKSFKLKEKQLLLSL